MLQRRGRVGALRWRGDPREGGGGIPDVRGLDLPAFFGPVITGEQRRSGFSVCVRVLPGQREPASPASAHRHPSQY